MSIWKEVYDAVKERRFISSCRRYIAKKILPDSYMITSRTVYLPYNRGLKICADDFVRVASLRLMAYEINDSKIEGNVAELGVYRGDFAKYINEFFPDRKLFLFDTFDGFADKDVKKDVKNGYSSGAEDFSDTNVDTVLKKMPAPQMCVIKKGWFPQTAEGVENERFAFVSLDADLFDPIYEGLSFFYPRLTKGGGIFIHDFNNPDYKGVSVAVKKFCTEQKIPYLCLADNAGSVVVLKR